MSTPSVRVPPVPSGVSWFTLARLIRLQNQTGTYLLLIPSLWALVLATRGVPDPTLIGVFVGGAFLMRSAGVVMNDLADQSFDRQVARTKTRPLASGELMNRHAFWLLISLLVVAGILLLILNPFVWRLAPIALLLAGLYPFMKRWIHMPQAVLGLAFGWGTIMAWAAVCERLDPAVWCLFGAAAAWAIGYDTIYAVQDQEDDRRIGVKSAALYFGPFIHHGVGLALGSMLVLLGTAGWLTGIRWPYYVVLGGVGSFFVHQIWQLRKPVTPAQALAMFRAHVWAGVAILIGMLAGFLP